jgi:cell division protein FtsW
LSELLAGLIVLQKDLGTALALLVTTALLLYMAGLNMKWIGVSASRRLPIGSIAFYFLVYQVPYRWNRILAFWNPEADPRGYGFQIISRSRPLAPVGIRGLGYMESKQKLSTCRTHTRISFLR